MSAFSSATPSGSQPLMLVLMCDRTDSSPRKPAFDCSRTDDVATISHSRRPDAICGCRSASFWRGRLSGPMFLATYALHAIIIAAIFRCPAHGLNLLSGLYRPVVARRAAFFGIGGLYVRPDGRRFGNPRSI